MDPQQRLLLETVVGGARAGRASTRPSLRGSADRRLRRRHAARTTPALLAPGREDVEGYLRTGNAASVVSGPGRLHPRARGPGGHGGHGVLVVAGRAAPGRSRRCGRASATLALAGGVTVMSTPGRLRRVQPAARAGRRTAGARRSPAAPTAPAGPRASGVLLLERLSDARRNGHQVLAVVRGSARSTRTARPTA